MLKSILKAFLSLLRRFLMLLPARHSPFTLADEGVGTSIIITSVFFWLIDRPNCRANIPGRVVFSSCANECVRPALGHRRNPLRSSRVKKRVHRMPVYGPMLLATSLSQSSGQVEEQHRHRTSLSNTGLHAALHVELL